MIVESTVFRPSAHFNITSLRSTRSITAIILEPHRSVPVSFDSILSAHRLIESSVPLTHRGAVERYHCPSRKRHVTGGINAI